MGEKGVIYRVLVGEREGKRPLGRPWRRWEDNTNMDLQEVGCERTGVWRSEIPTPHVTRHNTVIHNILSTAPQLSISH
jgi:hypothetical protein